MAPGLREHKDKGTELLAKGKVDAALVEFRKALRLVPQDAPLRQRVAELLAKTGKAQEAIAEYDQLAVRFAKEGQLLRAIAVCKVILQLDPTHTQTRARLLEYHQQRGDVLDQPAPPAPRPAVAPIAPRPVAAPRPAAPVPPPREVPVMTAAVPSAPAAPAPATAPPAAPAPRPDAPVPTEKLVQIPLFSELSPDEFQLVFDLVTVRNVATGETIIVEGELGTSIYAIVEGAVEVEHPQPGSTALPLARLEAGSFFGEMALVANVPRLATVRAAEETVLLELPREGLLELARRHPNVDQVVQSFYKQRLLANLLLSNPLFSAFDERERVLLMDRFRMRTFEPGEVLIEQGKPGIAFYVLLRGRCSVTQEIAPGISASQPDLEEGDVFGEIALLQDRPATASVRTAVRSVVLGLHRRVFETLVGGRPEVTQRLGRLVEERLGQSLIEANAATGGQGS